MPTYEYRCQECGAKFERQEHIAEHQQGSRRCPKCRSNKVSQVFSPFFAKTSHKS